MRKRVRNPFAMLLFGLLIGFISRLLDIFTTNFGEIFSQTAIWILLGTLISIYSKTAKKAMLNVLTLLLELGAVFFLVQSSGERIERMHEYEENEPQACKNHFFMPVGHGGNILHGVCKR